MGEGKPRFCASVTFDSHVIEGCGDTLEEARENLIKEIVRDETLFDYEKLHLIRQVRFLHEMSVV